MNVTAQVREIAQPKPGPAQVARLVCAEGQVVADAIVIVSPSDPNWARGPKAIYTDGVVTVRRA
jgi:hypothetical protein